MAVKKIPTLEQLSDRVGGIGRTLDRLGVQNREAREAANAANAGVESLAKKFGAVYDALVSGGVVPSPANAQVKPGTPTTPGGPPSSVPPPPGSGETSGAPEASAAPGPGPSWLAVASFYEAQAIMAVLVPWLAEVYLRYPDAALPTCWAWHPAAVEELWWLCRAWHHAYACEEPSSQKAGDWHDRQRPAVAKRLADTESAFQRCRLDKHADVADHAHPVVPGADTVAHVTTAWASDQRHAWPLAPTQPQLAADQIVQDARPTKRHFQ
jgi:hypothetical protein